MDRVLWSLGQDLKLNIVKSRNCTLIDSEGRKYFDLESGIWSASIGHSHEEITEVIKKQSGKVIHTGYCYADPVLDEASELILEILGFEGGRCGYLCSGSEAVVFGVRVIQALQEGKQLLTFSNGYFGSYGDAREKDERSWVHFNWIENCQNCNNECACCELFRSIPFEKTGGFVFEPGSSDFIKFPPEKLVVKIAEEVKSNGGLILSNEVTTGLGRTGKWFGFQHYNIEPDIVTMGKSIGNGYPVSVVAVNEKTSFLLEDKDFYYCQSHGNDALGAAVAKKVVEIIRRDNLVDKSERKGSILKTGLNEIAEKSPLIKEVRGRGLMIVIEFEENEDDPAHKIYRKLFEAGFVVSNYKGMGHIRIDPAYTIEEEIIEDFLKVFEKLLLK